MPPVSPDEKRDRSKQDALVRTITLDDAERFLALQRALSLETKFMLMEPEELRSVTHEIQQARLSGFIEEPSNRIFVAESHGELLGYLLASGNRTHRTAHCGYIVIGILKAHSGQGVGTKLFEELHSWAPTVGITRLELLVMVNNDRAIDLYRRLGYEIEGTKKGGVRVDGEYIDQYYMGKILSTVG